MRRTTTILAALTTGAALALGTAAPALAGTAAPALAAKGVLIIDGIQYNDPPRGCYAGKYWPLTADNHTDTRVFIYKDEYCRGQIVGELNPGQSGTFEFGSRVYVPN